MKTTAIGAKLHRSSACRCCGHEQATGLLQMKFRTLVQFRDVGMYPVLLLEHREGIATLDLPCISLRLRCSTFCMRVCSYRGSCQ